MAFTHKHTHIYEICDFRGIECDIITQWMQKFNVTESTKIFTVLYTDPYTKTLSQKLINVNLKNIRLGS
jgi:hypothetical protein